MSYKIAVATSDGVNVDLHFGVAESLKIYAVEGLEYHLVEERQTEVCKQEGDQGCSGGCGNGGGNGCAGGEKSESVNLISDCRAVVAAKIGRNVLRQLELKAISCFDVAMPINDALTKIIGYYHKVDNRKLKR